MTLNDEKHWYKGEVTGTRNYVVSSIRQMARVMAAAAGNEVYEVLNEDDFGQFIKKFQDAPFVFMRQVSKAEYEKMEAEKNGKPQL